MNKKNLINELNYMRYLNDFLSESFLVDELEDIQEFTFGRKEKAEPPKLRGHIDGDYSSNVSWGEQRPLTKKQTEDNEIVRRGEEKLARKFRNRRSVERVKRKMAGRSSRKYSNTPSISRRKGK